MERYRNKRCSISDNDDPEITDSTPSSATTGDSFTFNASVVDNIAVSNVYVEYWYGSGGHTNVSMSNVAGNYYEYDTTILDTLETLHYIISAVDSSGNWNNTGTKDVSISDNDLPSLDADNSDTSGTTGDIYHFNISASDNIEVASVNASWSHGSLSGNLALVKTGNYWTGTITLDHSLSNLIYTIQVNDSSGNYVRSSQKSISVSDNDLPSLDADNSDASGTCLLYTSDAADE